MIVLPVIFALSPANRRNRLLEMPYSLANCCKVFPTFSDFFLSLPERNILLSGVNTSIPVARHTNPTGRNEKNERGSYPADTRVSSITRLGGVPISVIIPPMLLANASGISSRLEEILAFAARLTTIGSINATVPVLLTNAPMAAVTMITSNSSRFSLVPASFNKCELIIFASPVWKIAPPTTNSPIIIMTIEFENPDSASSGVRMWNKSRSTSAHNATMSERSLPIAKDTAEMASIAIAVHISALL